MSRRKKLPPTHRLRTGPDFANSSRFHSAPFQRRQRPAPPARASIPRLHSAPLHRLKSSKTGRPRRHERVSFRQVPSAGRPRIRALPKLPPSRRPQHQSVLCRSARAAGLSPARRPPGDGPRLARPSEVGTAWPRAPVKATAWIGFAPVWHRECKTVAFAQHSFAVGCRPGVREPGAATLSPGPRRPA
jgi:hypothetical protein